MKWGKLQVAFPEVGSNYPFKMASHLQIMIKELSKLPGLGPRSGKRLALYFLTQYKEKFSYFIQVLQKARDTVSTCKECGNIDVQNPCTICQDPKRTSKQICVVAEVADLWAIEKIKTFYGTYVVLGGVLSAFDGRGPDALNIRMLHQKMTHNNDVEEVILALNATVEGQATNHFIADALSSYRTKITTLAHGIPIGGELEYLDDTTLQAALTRRFVLNDQGL